MRRIGPPVDELPDETLLAGYEACDPELAAAFVRRFQGKVFAIAMSVLRDSRAAEDVAQSAFERVWRHARTYDPRRGSVASWIGVITRNAAIDAARVRPLIPVDTSALLETVLGGRDAPIGPEQTAVDGESADALRTALRRLSPLQARAVVLAGIGGLSASQVATAEGVPLGTAKTRIRQAMLHLRASLEGVRTEHG